MDGITPRELFWHYIADEPTSVQSKLKNNESGPYLFFRRSKTPIQARLAQLFPPDKIPRVFLHGSPHIDNYAKTNFGYGIIDFDRAYIGPYIWDVVCVLLAINLRNPETHTQHIPKTIWQVFYDSYLYHFQHPELPSRPYAPLEFITPKKWELNIDFYLKDKHKWAKKLYHAPLSLDDPIALAVLADYKNNLPSTSILENFEITNVARAAGSFGRRR
ncbi:MAG: phosphotransferase, partial [Gammaproteobacteria bacterium]